MLSKYHVKSVNCEHVEDDEPVLEGNISVPGTAGEPNGAGLFKGSRSRDGVPGAWGSGRSWSMGLCPRGMGSSVGGPGRSWSMGLCPRGLGEGFLRVARVQGGCARRQGSRGPTAVKDKYYLLN